MTSIITIDGPSGTGKGTLASRLTRRLGWHLLDSGALYRVVAYQAQQLDVPLDEVETVAKIAGSLPLDFQIEGEAVRILLNSADITDSVRSEAAGSAASQVAALPEVRSALLLYQRNFLRPPGLVADGRDMGTVVFPTADLKIFLTASPNVRAR
ncbi:MAG: (d)CMP kinase, partial [Gammaproteobacteria bacterium]